MSARDLVAVFDVGKTNAKLVVADPDSGAALWTLTRPARQLPGSPWRAIDSDGAQTFLMEALASAPHRERIGTIIPVAHGACAALTSGDGLAVPILDYEEPALEEIAEAYAAERDPFAETFSPFLPFGLNLGRQIAFLQERRPKEFGRADRILLYPQYWSWLLTGIAAAELTSLGSHTDLWRPLAKDWSNLARRRGWTGLFPPIRPAGEALGPIKPDVARRAGLRPDVQVLCGIHDSNASFLNHLAVRDPSTPFAVVSTGTWIIILANAAPLDGLDETRDMLANVDAYGSPVATARFMGGREYEAIVGAAASAEPGPEDLDRALAANAFAWPSFTRAGGPFQGRLGRLENADGLSPPELSALATLYLALVTDAMLTLLRASGDVIVEGPLAANPLFGPLLAELRPESRAFRSPDRSGTLGGALALAGFEGRGEGPRLCLPLRARGLDEHKRIWSEKTR